MNNNINDLSNNIVYRPMPQMVLPEVVAQPQTALPEEVAQPQNRVEEIAQRVFGVVNNAIEAGGWRLSILETTMVILPFLARIYLS